MILSDPAFPAIEDLIMQHFFMGDYWHTGKRFE